jgi:hypothetical protein
MEGVCVDAMEKEGDTKSMVKYICAEEIEDDIDEFKKAEKIEIEIAHSTYDELHEKVFQECPEGYQCVEPIALYHEVLWSVGWGKTAGGKHIRDELHHALERWEYTTLRGGIANARPSMASLCVDIVPLTSSDRRSVVRLVVQ